MASDKIKTGETIIADFLTSLGNADNIDAATIKAIQDLFDAGKLNRTRLIQRLELARSKKESSITEPSDD